MINYDAKFVYLRTGLDFNTEVIVPVYDDKEGHKKKWALYRLLIMNDAKQKSPFIIQDYPDPDEGTNRTARVPRDNP